MSIQNELDKIKNAVYGREVRGAIHDGIKKAYDDASEKDNANMEVKMARGTFPTLTERLNADSIATNRVKQDLQNKIDKENVSVFDINKNKGLFDETYFTDEVKQQWAGETPIHATVADGSVTLEKTAFSKPISRNVFDKTKAKNQAIDGSNGELAGGSDYYSTGFIRVTDENKLFFSNNLSAYAFYNAKKEYISGKTLSVGIRTLDIIPSAVYVRVSFYHTNLNSFIASFDIITSYDEYQLGINKKYLGDFGSDSIQDGAITPVKTNFFEPAKNIAFKEYRIERNYVKHNDGTLDANSDYTTFMHVPLKELTNYTYNFNGQVALYDQNKKYVRGIFGGGSEIVKTLTTEVGEVYGSFSTKKPDIFQVEEGIESTPFEKAKLVVKNELLPSYLEKTKNEAINVPSKIYATVGEKMTIYNKNLVKENESTYNFSYAGGFGEQLDGRFEYTPSIAGTMKLVIEIYNRDNLLTQSKVDVVVSNARSTPVKVLLLGDSTVRANGDGHITAELMSKLDSNIELIGTMGTGENKWEGRGGWQTATYRTNTSYESVQNPFYSPVEKDFDFGYYLSENALSKPNVVIIQTGINDVFNAKTNTQAEDSIVKTMQEMLFIANNIKSHDASIKVAFNLTIPPNDSQATFGRAYGTSQNQWRYKYNNFMLVDKMIADLKEFDLINTHLAVNPMSDISDGVHPKLDGYQKMASVIYSYLNSI